MSELKERFKLLPLHAIVMALSGFASLIFMFIPMFELYVQYVPRKVYSHFTMLLSPKITTVLRDKTVELDFLKFGAVMFVATIIVSVAVMTLSLGYYLFVDNAKKKRIGCLIIMGLYFIRGALHVYTLSRMITPEILNVQKMTTQRLYVAQTLAGNILIVLLFIGMVAALYGALGLRMSLKMFSYPYILWVIVFTILPLLLIAFRAFFAKTSGGYEFTLGGFDILFENKTVTSTFYGMEVRLQEHFSVFLRSLDFAIWTTIGCLIISYPLAYILAGRTKRLHKQSSMMIMLFVLPMWMNTMLRTYAWRAFFGQTGVLNNLLKSAGLIADPIGFLKNPVAADIITKLVMVNDFLPFMLLPIYSILVKIDDSLSQASRDLGANGVQTFTRVIFPLSLPGVISGIQMVFMPSLTFFMIPDIISEGSTTTIGNTVQTFILNESSTYQQAGNVLSLLLLIFVLITMGLLRNQDKDAGSGGGMVL